MQTCDTYSRPVNPGVTASRAGRGAWCGASVVKDESMPIDETAVKGKLVNAEQLLAELFEPECKPSIRWLRGQTKSKSIPHIRIGHLVFFDMEMVRTALAGKNLVRHRMSAGRVQTAG